MSKLNEGYKGKREKTETVTEEKGKEASSIKNHNIM